MESKRVPSARSAIDSTPIATSSSNLHTQQRQLTGMLADAKEENKELNKRVSELQTELESAKEALSLETLHTQKQSAQCLQLQAELDKRSKQVLLDS